jgi:hypothetical protein
MATWILRKSVDWEREGAPRPCASPRADARDVGSLTVEQQTAVLLGDDENAADDVDGQRKIFRGNQLVGYILMLSTE